jgi:hypothetical protein
VDLPISMPPPRSIWDLPEPADPSPFDSAPATQPGEPPPEVLAAQQLTEVPVEKPSPHDTIFGEDLLDEKSLDEVILSYLADDLDSLL